MPEEYGENQLRFDTIAISQQALEGLQNKVDIVNRRAERYGFPGRLVLEAGEPYAVATQPHLGEASPVDILVDARLAAQGEVVLEGGWKFVALIEHGAGLGGDLNVIKKAPGSSVEVPIQFTTAEALCEHCQKVRRRNNTYLLQRETGQFVQVGSACTKDFLGISPTQMLNWALLVDQGIEYTTGGYGGGEQRAWWSEYFLTAVAACVRLHGWSPRSYSGYSTADRALDWMRTHSKDLEVTNEDIKLAVEVLEWARNVEGDSDYLRNLQAVSTNNFVLYKNVGILASAVAAYNKEKELETKRQEVAAKKPSDWLGVQGTKLDAVVKVDKVLAFDDGFGGTKLLLKLEDPNDNILICWTGANTVTAGHLAESVGDSFAITGTVKEHDDYNGTRQTVLTRVKVLGTA